MYVIKCPNFRPKKVKDEYKDRVKCNHVIGFIEDLKDAELYYLCAVCGTTHKLTIKNKDAILSLVPDNSKLDYNNVLAYKTEGYQTKGY